MRIMKSKAADPTYHVMQDIKRDGKRSTEIIENLGHASEICRKYNVSDADIWADEYIKNLRNSAKAQEHKILIPFVTDSVIEKNKSLSFNTGYLFILHQSFTGVFAASLATSFVFGVLHGTLTQCFIVFLQVSCSVLFLRKQVIYGCVYLMHSLYNFLTMAIAYQIPCGFWTVILHATCLVMLLSAYYVRYVSDWSRGALSCPNLRQKCVNDNCEGFV